MKVACVDQYRIKHFLKLTSTLIVGSVKVDYLSHESLAIQHKSSLMIYFYIFTFLLLLSPFALL